MRKRKTSKGISARAWFYGQPGFHSPRTVAIGGGPTVGGLNCIYCGKSTGGPEDMCVPCAMKRLRIDRKDR